MIYYDAIGKKLSLTASDYFAFSVVYTPPPARSSASKTIPAHQRPQPHNEGLVDVAS